MSSISNQIRTKYIIYLIWKKVQFINLIGIVKSINYLEHLMTYKKKESNYIIIKE